MVAAYLAARRTAFWVLTKSVLENCVLITPAIVFNQLKPRLTYGKKIFIYVYLYFFFSHFYVELMLLISPMLCLLLFPCQPLMRDPCASLPGDALTVPTVALFLLITSVLAKFDGRMPFLTSTPTIYPGLVPALKRLVYICIFVLLTFIKILITLHDIIFLANTTIGDFS